MAEDKKESVIKEFGLSSFSIKNRTSVLILGLIIIISGISSYLSMPKEQFPEVVLPTVYVNTIYPGNSPVDIENLITRPIEKELKSVDGVKKITSTSAQDVSAIVVEFNEDAVISEALTDAKDAVDKAKKDLPTDLDNDPSVAELDLSEVPVVVINLSGDFEVDKLKEYAEYLQDEIEELQEVSEVNLFGDVEREIQINVDLFKMEALQVSFRDIEGAVANENLTISGGEILTDGFRRSMRVAGEFERIDQIERIIVKSEKQKPIYLKDVAEVKDSYVERDSYTRMATGDFVKEGALPVISLMVKKRNNENLLNASVKIDEILAEARESRLPESLSIKLTNDQSEDMKLQISNLENSIISGVILVVIVLMFFMGLRNAGFVGIAIPLSMFMSFMVLNVLGVTVNMVVLFALILALGMLVDNAIVVIENIYRLREEGYGMIQAAKEGVGEVAWPIIGSTATTLAAFVPLAFWGGLMGEFMKYLPITLIIVLSSSLFVGLVINPVIAALFMRVANKDSVDRSKSVVKRHLAEVIIGGVFLVLALAFYGMRVAEIGDMSYAQGNIFMTVALITLGNVFILAPASHWFQDVLLVALEKIYLKVLRFALTKWRPYAFFGGTLMLLVFSLMLVGVFTPQTSLFPNNEPKEIYVMLELPQGTDVETTNKFTKKVEQRVYKAMNPHQDIIKSIVTNVGEGASDPSAGFTGGPGITPNKSRITVSFVSYEFRKGKMTSEIMKELGKEMENVAGAKIVMSKDAAGPPVGKPISVELTGEDYVTLLTEAEKVKTLIERAKIPGIDQLEIEAETGKPELILEVDRDKALKYGLSTGLIASTLRTALFGKEISKFKDGDDDFPIQLRLSDKYRYNLQNLLNQRITFRDNMGKIHQVPVSSVAKVEYTSSFGSVKRKDLDRLVAVSSNVKEGYNADVINAQIKTLLDAYEMPEGYSYRFGGEQEEQKKSMEFLMSAMAIAVSAIFLILVSQFNSVFKPFIIVMSVLFSTIGVFLGLVITQMNFIIIMTGIGIISLAGVVVNNAIVLIDYIELIRQRKRKELGLGEGESLPKEVIIECLVEGGYTRLRPVLLTAITTVLGLVPLAIGLNIDFFGLYKDFEPNIYMGGDNAIFWGPMAWTVIYGLVFATFLTLIIVPVMLYLIDLAKMLVSSKGSSKNKIKKEPPLA